MSRIIGSISWDLKYEKFVLEFTLLQYFRIFLQHFEYIRLDWQYIFRYDVQMMEAVNGFFKFSLASSWRFVDADSCKQKDYNVAYNIHIVSGLHCYIVQLGCFEGGNLNLECATIPLMNFNKIKTKLKYCV